MAGVTLQRSLSFNGFSHVQQAAVYSVRSQPRERIVCGAVGLGEAFGLALGCQH